MSTEPSGGAEARTPPLNPDEANEAPTREYHGEGIRPVVRPTLHSQRQLRSLPAAGVRSPAKAMDRCYRGFR